MKGGLRERLEGGPPLVAVDPKGAASALLDALARAGTEALFIDREGDVVSAEDAPGFVDRARQAGLDTLLRCRDRSPKAIEEALDSGADGIVLPQVESAGDCTALTAAIAGRGAHGRVVIPQIETRAAVADLDALVGLADVDAFLIGPNDLAADMGHAGAPSHPDVARTLADIVARLKSAGRAFGHPATSPEEADVWRGRGATLLYVPFNALIAHGLHAFTLPRTTP